MEYIFDSKDKYEGFLDELNQYCDELRVIEDMDIDTIFWNQMEPYLLGYCWTRRFPGHGKHENLKILKYRLTDNVINILKRYKSFLDIGYDYVYDDGIDLAFYKNDKLIFWVLNHEDMCYLEDFAELHFEKTIEYFGIKSR